MEKILVVTVGGSCQPIVTSIRTLQPNRVIFLCSDGDKGSKSQIFGAGNPCEVRRGTEVIERLPNIITQAEFGNRFQPNRDVVLIQNPDDLTECYHLAANTIFTLQQEAPNAQLMADYTGGTKSMAAALVLAAVDYQIPLYITTATTRQNLVRVEQGEFTRRTDTTQLRNRDKL